jgi:hypothetical protein
MIKNNFGRCRNVTTLTIFKVTFFFFMKDCSVNLLRAVLYKLILVLHKDTLFHFTSLKMGGIL